MITYYSHGDVAWCKKPLHTAIVLLLLLLCQWQAAAQEDSGEAAPMSPEAQALDLAAKSVALKQAKLDYMQDALTGAFATINKPEVSDKALPEAQLAAYAALQQVITKAVTREQKNIGTKCKRLIVGYDTLPVDMVRYVLYKRNSKSVRDGLDAFNRSYSTKQLSDENGLLGVGAATAVFSMISQLVQTSEVTGGASIQVGDRSLVLLVMDQLTESFDANDITHPPISPPNVVAFMDQLKVAEISSKRRPISKLHQDLDRIIAMVAQWRKEEEKVKPILVEAIRKAVGEVSNEWDKVWPEPAAQFSMDSIEMSAQQVRSRAQAVVSGADQVLGLLTNQESVSVLRSVIQGFEVCRASAKCEDVSSEMKGEWPRSNASATDSPATPSMEQVLRAINSGTKKLQEGIEDLDQKIKKLPQRLAETLKGKVPPYEVNPSQEPAAARQALNGRDSCIVDVVVHTAGGSHRYHRDLWQNIVRGEGLGLRGVSFVSLLVRTLDNKIVASGSSAAIATFGRVKKFKDFEVLDVSAKE